MGAGSGCFPVVSRNRNRERQGVHFVVQFPDLDEQVEETVRQQADVFDVPAARIEETLEPLKEAGARMVVPLKVSGAFHSRMMEGPAEEFGVFLEQFEFSEPELPVYSNVEAAPYPDAASIPRLLVRQIHSPVRWTETILGMRGAGASEFEECGPGSVLTKLLRQIV